MTDAKPSPDDCRTPPGAWHDVTVRYPYRKRTAVGPATLEIAPGERLLLLGPSGSGKSSLLHMLTGLVPQAIPANVGGRASIRGEDVAARTPAQWAAMVAQLFQNPEQTLCGMTVADEVAFALENQGMPARRIEARVAAALDRVGFPSGQHARRTMTLSGGEKQLVALAALIAQDAPLHVVDEPTAHLAPAAASRLRALLMTEQGERATLVVDHQVDALIASIDRVAVLDGQGQLIGEGEPRRLFRCMHDRLAAMGVRLPLAVELDAKLSEAGMKLPVPPLTMAEALAAIDRLPPEQRAAARRVAWTFAAGHVAPSPEPHESAEPVAALSHADCAPLFGPVVLRDVSLRIAAGETVALLGPNGAGKTTLGATLAGLLRLKAGRRSGEMGGMSFQNPEHQFLTGSVRDELLSALPPDAGAEEAGRVLAEWRLDELAGSHPFELSQGQKRRLSLASLTAGRNRPLLVLDEPTAGLDGAGKTALESEVARLTASGHAVLVITHDLDFALKTCSRALIVADGALVADGPTRQLLADPELLRRAGLDEPTIFPLLRWLECCRC